MKEKERKKLNLERERTQYSNERTLMSYVRTFIELFIMIVSLFHFFKIILKIKINWLIITAGAILFLMGLCILYVGIRNYIRRKEKLAKNEASEKGDDNKKNWL